MLYKKIDSHKDYLDLAILAALHRVVPDYGFPSSLQTPVDLHRLPVSVLYLLHPEDDVDGPPQVRVVQGLEASDDGEPVEDSQPLGVETAALQDKVSGEFLSKVDSCEVKGRSA